MDKINVSLLKPNKDNPRTIKKDQLEKLKKSIKAFPRMLELRPIIVDDNLVVLGGNMRLRALKELGIEEVPYIKAEDLTEEQKQEFIIKDNVNYGDWNWETLSLEWDLNSIGDWGLDIPSWLNDDDEEPTFDEDINSKYLDTYVNAKIKQIVLFLSAEQYEDTLEKLEGIMEDNDLESNTEAILFLIKYYRKELWKSYT